LLGGVLADAQADMSDTQRTGSIGTANLDKKGRRKREGVHASEADLRARGHISVGPGSNKGQRKREKAEALDGLGKG